MRIKQHWLVDAEHCPSPHFNQRPAHAVIDMIVIHNISLPPKQFGAQYIKDFFQGKLDHSQHAYFESIKTLKVSAHLLIDRLGQITQFVSFANRAWHAGQSVWQGCENCNDFSIGIELEGADDIAFTESQYRALNTVIHLLQQHYPSISKDRIVGHSDIAPGRKTDPGPAFDWQQIAVKFAI